MLASEERNGGAGRAALATRPPMCGSVGGPANSSGGTHLRSACWVLCQILPVPYWKTVTSRSSVAAESVMSVTSRRASQIGMLDQRLSHWPSKLRLTSCGHHAPGRNDDANVEHVGRPVAIPDRCARDGRDIPGIAGHCPEVGELFPGTVAMTHRVPDAARAHVRDRDDVQFAIDVSAGNKSARAPVGSAWFLMLWNSSQ